jgi:hypothetical protein
LNLESCEKFEGRERDPAFADTIKRAKQRIENFAEEKLYDKDYPTRGVIFSLSNNAERWTEKKDSTVHFPEDGAAELAKAMMSGDTAVAANDPQPDTGSEESNS